MIVDRLLAKLEPVVEDQFKITSLNGWTFERTHAKKDPTALKWRLTPPRKLKISGKKAFTAIVSRFTVKELLHSDAYSLVVWQDLLLLSPAKSESLVNPAIDQLNAVESSAKKLAKALATGEVKSKDALIQVVKLIEQMAVTLKGKTYRAPNTNPVIVATTTSKPEPTAPREEKRPVPLGAGASL